jgi:1,4-dihydroxy-2-naphthoate octaprenyltransferase
MVAPVALGGATAYYVTKAFDPFLFSLSLIGAVLLHLAANAIDDVYDFASGVDAIAERVFPKDAPGWKPVARGLVTLREGLVVSAVLYGASILIGVYLSFVVGWLVLGIALPGILLSVAYTVPPLKLDYRGLGLGELSILLSFGPLPALGTYFVLTRSLSVFPVLAGIPSGLLTTGILISHDMIFQEVYIEAKKLSLEAVLGRKLATQVFSVTGVLAYVVVFALIAAGFLPWYSLAVLLALPVFLTVADFKGVERPPPAYGPRTIRAFLHSVLFTALLAASLL